MGLFVILTVFLFQKGSSESKDPDKKEKVDRKPDPKRKSAPWPVKKGGWLLKLYSHSLSLSLLLLFLLSFLFHWYGSLKAENEQRGLNGLPAYNATDHLQSSSFWFESFQNWQSEFLSIFVIVIFSIYLREAGSSQSKPVDAAHSETGE